MKMVKVGVAALNQTPLDWEGNLQNIRDALSEALDWATIDVDGDGERVPLLTDVRDDPSHDEIHGAVRTWVLAMGARYNSGYQWPHPTARRAFPPTQVNRVE